MRYNKKNFTGLQKEMKTRHELADELIGSYIDRLSAKLEHEPDELRQKALGNSILKAGIDRTEIHKCNPEQLENLFKDYLGEHSKLTVDAMRAEARKKPKVNAPPKP